MEKLSIFESLSTLKEEAEPADVSKIAQLFFCKIYSQASSF